MATRRPPSHLRCQVHRGEMEGAGTAAAAPRADGARILVPREEASGEEDGIARKSLRSLSPNLPELQVVCEEGEWCYLDLDSA
eukprot:750476-Hanusia_phi.AAC.2